MRGMRAGWGPRRTGDVEGERARGAPEVVKHCSETLCVCNCLVDISLSLPGAPDA